MSNRKNGILKELVEQCRSGDQKAWHKLIDLVSPIIFSICKRMRLSREESFDVFGQVSCVLVKNIHELRSADKLISYVASVTRRQVSDIYRKIQFIDTTSEGKLNYLPDSSDKIPDKIYEQSERKALLMKALLSLPEREYQLISALFLENNKLSYEQLARKLDMPVSSIGPTRARSLEKLYKILKNKHKHFENDIQNNHVFIDRQKK